jgi:hypothetical protein
MYVLPARAPTHWCYTNKVVIIEEARADTLGVLRSVAFCEWIVEFCTSFGVGSGISPSISKGIDTFVLPPPSAAVQELGEKWHVSSDSWCVRNRKGLTALQNALHSDEPGVEELRSIQRDLDCAVVDAYGWPDLELRHDFHDTPQGTRYGVAGAAREDLLNRLRQLNHERMAEPEASRRGGAGTASRGRASAAPDLQTAMFGDD